jgi:hypothetical protein
LAWNPDLSARQIIDEWTIQTFGPETVDTISKMQLTSWRTYENYTGPLGLQTLTDIVGNQYGVAVEASERNGWGQWHRAARCTASFHYEGPSGWHEIRIQYFDQSTGISSFRLFVGAQLINQWTAADQVPERRNKIDSSSSTRRTITGIALRKGDEIRIEGVPDGPEHAALDYVEIK